MIIYNRSINIGIVAGEVSGDLLGSGLIQELKKYLRKAHFFGIGGDRMRSENMECWHDISELSVMGITEVIFNLHRLLSIRTNLIDRFLKLKIDVFIGIDFPDFNIGLEKRLKKRGICTIHYVSPSIWAWRFNRIFDIKKAVDNILLLFPFEESIYNYFKIPCQFVGHTLADEIPLNPNKIAMRQKLDIAINKNCLAILPGSRIKEIKILTPYFLSCIELLYNKLSHLEVIVVLHNQSLVNQFIKESSLSTVKYRILNTKKSWEVMMASDVSLLTSGTATLECMLSKCPMVVAYRMNPLIFILIRRFIKTSWISLPNLLAGQSLVQEFVQKNCTPNTLSEAVLTILNYDKNQYLALQKKFHQIHKSIKINANERAAYEVLKFIKF